MSLLRELERVRTRLRWCMLLRGIVLWCGCLLMCLLAVGSLDWFWQPEDLRSRWGLLIVLGAGIVFLAWTFIVRPWSVPLTATDVALQLERSDPRWRGQLAAAAAFGTTPALSDTEILSEEHHPTWKLRWWPLVPAAMPLLVSLSVLLSLWVLKPQLVQIGLARTLIPSDPIRWPRHTELQMLSAKGNLLSPVHPWKVDARQPLTLYVADREGLPPSEVELQMKFPSGHTESHTLRPSTQPAPKNAPGPFQFSWLPATGTTWVRVRGGDDDSVGWCPIEASTAPVVTQTHVALTYPEYLQLPPRELSSLPARLSLPVGTMLQVQGTLDRPVQELLFRTTSGESHELPLSEDGKSFTWQETIVSGPQQIFWFEPMDDSGLTATRPPRHELIPITDALPEVQVLVPEQDLLIAPEARLPWELHLQDDDRIESAELVLTVGNEDSRIAWSVDWSDASATPRVVRGWLDFGPQPPSAMSDVASEADANVIYLPGLAIGTDVRMTGRARDSHPGDDRWANSSPRVLRIISVAEKLQELGQRVAGPSQTLTEQGDLLTRHQQVLRDLRQRAEQRELVIPDDIQSLASCRQWLNQFEDLLGDGMGVRYQLRQIIQESEQNRLPPADLAQPLSEVEAQLKYMQERELVVFRDAFAELEPAIERLRDASESTEWSPPSSTDLIRAELAGESLRQGWNEMLTQLARWSRQLDFRDRFDELYAAGQSSREATLALAQRTLARPAASLTPDERAALKQLVEQYQQLSVDAEQLQRPLAADQQTSPLIQSAQQRWKAANAAIKFHHVANALQQNNMGQALQGQAELQGLLNEIRTLLSETSLASDDLLFEKLKEQRQQVESLLAREQQLIEAIQSATLSEDSQSRAELDRLIKHSEELLQLSQHLRRQLQSMQLDGPTRPLDTVSEHLQATRLQLAARQRTEALNQLDLARKQTATVIRSLQELEHQFSLDLIRQHLASFSQSCADLATRQAQLTHETVRLRELQLAETRWTRGLLKSLLESSTRQSQLADELTELRLQVADLSLVQVVTDDIIKDMRASADKLQDREVSDDTERRQRKAEALLISLAETLLAPTTQHNRTPAHSTTGEAVHGQQHEELPPAKAAELKLLLALQDDLNRRSREFSDSMSDSPAAEQLKQSLLEEQRRLATWASALLQEQVTGSADAPR
ncbi:MAG: hypothetical protein KDA90_12785 [Planctomycetaceae bacterium]|nr:hypothetical protein [Planctomycetaceae bacterium]